MLGLVILMNALFFVFFGISIFFFFFVILVHVIVCGGVVCVYICHSRGVFSEILGIIPNTSPKINKLRERVGFW